MKEEKRLPIDFIRSILEYDPATGLLRWKWRSDVPNNVNARLHGAVAGTIQKSGYVSINIRDTRYCGHVLAWTIATGRWPEHEIDHRDPPRSNNALSNLREATTAQNRRNSLLQKRNTSGRKGVSWDRANRRWVAQICVDGKQRHIGRFDTLEDAHAAYCSAARELHGEFANFGTGHAVVEATAPLA